MFTAAAVNPRLYKDCGSHSTKQQRWRCYGNGAVRSLSSSPICMVGAWRPVAAALFNARASLLRYLAPLVKNAPQPDACNHTVKPGTCLSKWVQMRVCASLTSPLVATSCVAEGKRVMMMMKRLNYNQPNCWLGRGRGGHEYATARRQL